MNTAKIIAVMAALAAALLMLASMPAADAAGTGTASDPYDALSVTADEAASMSGPVHVYVGSNVSITDGTSWEILEIEDTGFGLDYSSSGVSGTLSKAGQVTITFTSSLNHEVEDSITIKAVERSTSSPRITFASNPAEAGNLTAENAVVANGTTLTVTGGSVKANGTTLCAATAKAGYAFIGWSAPTGAITSNQTVTANFVAVGTLQEPLESLSLTTSQAMHLGDIAKFYVRTGGSVSIPNISADGYDLTFTGNISPVGSGLSVRGGLIGTLATVQTNTEYAATYNWAGTQASHGTGTVRIVAVSGQPADTVTVSFSANGGIVTPAWFSVANGSAISANGSIITVGDKTATATADSTHRFAGWEGIPADGKATEDVTITARFAEVAAGTAVISYFDGSTLVGIQQVTMPATGSAKATVTQPASMEKDGYTLKGWTVAGDESGKLIANGDKVDVPSGGISLTAVWEKNTSWMDYAPYAIALIGIILAIIGFMVNPVLIVAGVAVAVLGALEALGWINLL